jgi:hypothetical protein
VSKHYWWCKPFSFYFNWWAIRGWNKSQQFKVCSGFVGWQCGGGKVKAFRDFWTVPRVKIGASNLGS